MGAAWVDVEDEARARAVVGSAFDEFAQIAGDIASHARMQLLRDIRQIVREEVGRIASSGVAIRPKGETESTLRTAYAKCWRNEPLMHGDPISSDCMDDILRRRDTFDILIVRRQGVKSGRDDAVYFHGARVRMSLQKRRLLALCLKGHGVAGPYEKLAEEVWCEGDLANTLRALREESLMDPRAKVELHEKASKIRKAASRLSRYLYEMASIRFESVTDDGYCITPIPRRYCMLEAS